MLECATDYCVQGYCFWMRLTAGFQVSVVAYCSRLACHDGEGALIDYGAAGVQHRVLEKTDAKKTSR